MALFRDNTTEAPASTIKVYPASIMVSGAPKQEAGATWVDAWFEGPEETLVGTFVQRSTGFIQIMSSIKFTVTCLAETSGCKVRVVGKRHVDDPGLDEVVAEVTLVADTRTVIADSVDCSGFTHLSVQMKDGNADNDLNVWVYAL